MSWSLWCVLGCCFVSVAAAQRQLGMQPTHAALEQALAPMLVRQLHSAQKSCACRNMLVGCISQHLLGCTCYCSWCCHYPQESERDPYVWRICAYDITHRCLQRSQCCAVAWHGKQVYCCVVAPGVVECSVYEIHLRQRPLVLPRCFGVHQRGLLLCQLSTAMQLQLCQASCKAAPELLECNSRTTSRHCHVRIFL